MPNHVCSLRYICTAFFQAGTLKVPFLCTVSIFRYEMSVAAFWSNVSAAVLLLSPPFWLCVWAANWQPSNKCELVLYSCGFYFAFKRLKTVTQLSSVGGFLLICCSWNPACPTHHVKRAKVTTKVNIFLSSLSDKIEDELEMTTVCHRPEGLEQLEAQTNFTKRELQVLYRGFKNVRTVLQWIESNMYVPISLNCSACFSIIPLLSISSFVLDLPYHCKMNTICLSI